MRQLKCTAAMLVALALGTIACGGGGDGDVGTPSPTPVATDSLVGAAGASAVGVIPTLDYAPRGTDFAADDPTLPGLPLSFNSLLVVVKPTATVGAVNALLRSVGATIVGGIPGKAGAAPGLLALRLPTASHAELAGPLAALRAAPEFAAVTQDVVIRFSAVTRLGASNWLWDAVGSPTLGTWPLVAMRVPQLWNLNPTLEASGATVPTGVLDDGILADHEDLAGRVAINGTPQTGLHGTYVSGIIAARFNNGKGIDGVNPFATIVFQPTTVPNIDSAATLGDADWGLYQLIEGHPELDVVNVSMGYNWAKLPQPVNTLTNADARARASTDGFIVRATLEALAATAPLPFITVAAGNDSDNQPVQEARWASPFANAALEHGVAAITVVESDSAVASGPLVSYVRSSFSNSGGHLSAPGSNVTSADSGTTRYGLRSGTSFAAPMVAGVVGYLYALEPDLPRPSLTSNPVRDLLLATLNGSPNRNGRPQVDAFAAAMRLDVVTGSERVLRRLLDIDDGTFDGNRRVNPVSGTVIDLDAPAADNGRIDMADFRRWRDWLLTVEDAPGLVLDGASDNPKRDVNGDGVNGVADQERIFPRGDFNGDGRLSRTATATVPGVLAGSGPLTDLQVLQARFSDPNYQAAALPGLIESGDVQVTVAACLAVATASSVVIRVKDAASGNELQTRTVPAGGEPTQVFTVPTGASRQLQLEAEARSLLGSLVTSTTTRTLRLGEDAAWSPECTVPPLASPPPSGGSTATPGQPYSLQLTATGGVPPYTWSATGLPAGLSINPSTGLISGTPTGGTSTVTVTVRSADGQVQTFSFTITVTVAPPPPADPWIGRWVGTRTDRRVFPNQTTEYVWELQRDAFSDTRQYVSFPGTDFQCTIVPSANDASFTGFCGNILNSFYNVRGTRSGSTIDGIGDRPSTTFVDDYTFTLTKQ